MAQHISAGTRPYNTGLMLLPKSAEIDTSEFGLKQGQFDFLLANSLWPAKEPVRGTACPDFIGGDALTNTFLDALPFMGAQTMRWKPSARSPGIGILEIICQGAKFDPAYESGNVTPYFLQITTTREDLTFSIYDSTAQASAGGGPPPATPVNYNVRLATTGPLPACSVINGGDGLVGAAPNGYLQIDGSGVPYAGIQAIAPLQPTQFVLVKDQTNTANNGIYSVRDAGTTLTTGFQPWRLDRIGALSSAGAANFSTSVMVNVADGATNHGTQWNMVLGGGPFVFNSTPVTFSLVSGPGSALNPAGTPVTPLYNVHLDYHSIDLHFEYMAKVRQQKLRYILSEYIYSGGFIEVAPGVSQDLSIESAQAQSLKSASPAVWAKATDDLWRNSVTYPGAAARLDQTPAGQYWHVLETASVKIQPILPNVANIA